MSSAPRVLCYSPYTKWALHGLWEATILHALRLRGADLRYVLCDGLYSDCDMYWTATAPRHELSCTHCQAEATSLMHRMGMTFHWLGRYVTLDERREARSWERSLARDELPSAAYEGWPVARWTRSSVHSHFRCSELDLDDPVIETAVRNYLQSGLVACFGIRRLLADYQPDVLFLFNGRQSSLRVALELARREGIRVVCHERGPRKETLVLTEDERCLSLQPIRKVWSEWGEVPLSAGELCETAAFLSDREQGVGLGWKAYTRPPQPPGDVRAALSLSADRPLWALFTSSDDEVKSEDDWQGPFSSQLDWIERTVDYARRREDVDLVVRAHPNTGGKSSTGINEKQLHELTALRSALPPNARLVMPDDEISSYTLMELATVGLVSHSTVGLELACKGKTAVVWSGNMVAGTPFVRTVADAAAYETLLDELAGTPNGAVSDETRRLAHRFAHACFFKACLPFPLVRMPDPGTGVLAYDTLEALLPARDESLDRAAGILLDAAPVVPPPTDTELARDDTDEQAFFGLGSTAPARIVRAGAPGTPPRRTPTRADRVARRIAAAPSPRVSVVMPCFNYGHHLEEAVESVLAQTYRDFELIVVDDGSTDDSLAVAERLAGAHEQVTVLAQENAGQPAIARNNGIARARGEYVLPLDADDAIEPDYLERLVAALDADETVSIAYGDQQNFGADGMLHVHPPYDFGLLAQCNPISVASLFRRLAWEEVGGYATNVRGYEDWDFWIGCGENGHLGRWVPGAVFRYRVKAGGVFEDAQRRDLGLKAQIIRNHPRVFGEVHQAWATAALAGDPAALASNPGLGLIPSLGRTFGPAPVSARTVSVLAFADELRARPELLRAYVRALDDGDDVTLVVAVPAGGLPGFEAAALAAGLDAPESPDVLVVPGGAPWEVAALGRGMSAVYSTETPMRPLRALSRFDGSTVDGIRLLAQTAQAQAV